jgi:uncharacterized protein YndB with AHSA1/START domain
MIEQQPAVNASVTVEASQARAFAVFTEGLGTWWQLGDKHIGETPPETAVMEPREGGRWFERAADGGECDWGRVLAWEPPERLVLSWQIDAAWKHDPDPANGSEIEVRFIPEGPSTTRVDLEHRGFERHGAGGETIRAAVGSEGGWPGLLRAYADLAARS